VAIGSTTLILYVALGTVLGRVLGDTSYGQLALFNEVVRLVLDAYVEPVNLDRAMSGAEFGMVDSLDGESAYLDPAAFRAFQNPPREPQAEVGVVLSASRSSPWSPPGPVLPPTQGACGPAT
jgi:hypothetical protein